MGNLEKPSRNYTASGDLLRFTVPAELAGKRLDQALALLVPGHSRSRLATLIREGQVTVGGLASEAKAKVHSGEAVEVNLLPRPEDEAHQPEEMALAIVHEDKEVLVIDKPAGLVVHPGSGNWQGTLLNALLHHLPQLKRLPRAGIVHRLDKDTSGLLVVAKTESAQLSLVNQLKDHSVQRIYLAVVRGKPPAEGTVSAPIGRHPTQRTRMAVVHGGKPAVTHYKVIRRYPAHALVECRLETGRTHQIRVHMASAGFPLEGDAVYAGRGPRRFPRQALHAWRLAFTHPGTGKLVSFESPQPEDFHALLAELSVRAPAPA
jgi:23S rRNA pseudouridine1911/1915/1917 synthase